LQTGLAAQQLAEEQRKRDEAVAAEERERQLAKQRKAEELAAIVDRITQNMARSTNSRKAFLPR
jgi:hypothetical protein